MRFPFLIYLISYGIHFRLKFVSLKMAMYAENVWKIQHWTHFLTLSSVSRVVIVFTGHVSHHASFPVLFHSLNRSHCCVLSPNWIMDSRYPTKRQWNSQTKVIILWNIGRTVDRNCCESRWTLKSTTASSRTKSG